LQCIVIGSFHVQNHGVPDRFEILLPSLQTFSVELSLIREYLALLDFIVFLITGVVSFPKDSLYLYSRTAFAGGYRKFSIFCL